MRHPCATLTMDFELSLDYATIQALSLHNLNNLKYDVYVKCVSVHLSVDDEK